LVEGNAVITAEELRSFVEYNPDTGVFIRIKRCDHHARVQIGDVVGGKTRTGYVCGCIGRHKILLHRAAWLYVYGEFPPGPIDHINRDRSDNRICNLRLADKSRNAMNRASVSKHGFKGIIYRHRLGKYLAYIGTARTKNRKYLGYHNTVEDAARAYDAAARERYGEFALLNFPNSEALK
jgi:hypothetical protein